MGMQYPVHPDDIEQLLRIRRYLIGHRITNGWTQRELSQRANGTDGMAYDLESNESWQWRLSRLQDWCAAFDLRLDARISVGALIDKKIHSDPEVAPLYAMSRNPQCWKMFQRAYLTAALRSVRRAKKLRAEDIGREFGCTASAIRNWERDSDQIMLPKVLRYARILGGRIELGLDGHDH